MTQRRIPQSTLPNGNVFGDKLNAEVTAISNTKIGGSRNGLYFGNIGYTNHQEVIFGFAGPRFTGQLDSQFTHTFAASNATAYAFSSGVVSFSVDSVDFDCYTATWSEARIYVDLLVGGETFTGSVVETVDPDGGFQFDDSVISPPASPAYYGPYTNGVLPAYGGTATQYIRIRNENGTRPTVQSADLRVDINFMGFQESGSFT